MRYQIPGGGDLSVAVISSHPYPPRRGERWGGEL